MSKRKWSLTHQIVDVQLENILERKKIEKIIKLALKTLHDKKGLRMSCVDVSAI
jgi:hypothetical protein